MKNPQNTSAPGPLVKSGNEIVARTKHHVLYYRISETETRIYSYDKATTDESLHISPRCIPKQSSMALGKPPPVPLQTIFLLYRREDLSRIFTFSSDSTITTGFHGEGWVSAAKVYSSQTQPRKTGNKSCLLSFPFSWIKLSSHQTNIFFISDSKFPGRQTGRYVGWDWILAFMLS